MGLGFSEKLRDAPESLLDHVKDSDIDGVGRDNTDVRLMPRKRLCNKRGAFQEYRVFL